MGGVNRVEGSASSIAFTQRGSVHYWQPLIMNGTTIPTRTSMGGFVVAGSIKQVGGRMRYENNLRNASASVRQSVDFRSIAPNRLFRSHF